LRQRQKGIFLLELGLALMLALIGAVWAGAHVMQAVRDGQAEATGNYLLAVKGAMDGAIAGSFNAYARGLPLTNADGSARFVDAMAPTLAELRALGHLPVSFPSVTPAGQSVSIRVRRDASRCPGVGCRVDALIHTTTPFRAAMGGIDYDAAAVAVNTMQGWGGAAWFDNPAQIRGASFVLDNPVSSSAGGVVGVMAMLDTSMWNQFVRMGDDRDPALQGNLSLQGSTSASRVGLRETVVPNTACTATDFANPATPSVTPISLAGNIEYARTASGGLVGCIGNMWRSVAVVASVGGACGDAAYPEGTLGTDPSGAGLLCRDAVWSPISQWLSRYTIMTTHLAPQVLTGSATATAVPKPACGLSGGVAGVPSVYVIPQSLQNRGSFALSGSLSGDNISVSGTMTLDPLNFQASNAGPNWSVSAPANSQAVVVTYCAYS
jgi:type II secretory pathway pseudopilin PulG